MINAAEAPIPRRVGAAAFHPLTVAEVRPLCADAVAIGFDVPSDLAPQYAFAPGQALTLRRILDGREERRSYSICAARGERLRVGVREVRGGLFSTWLVRDVRPGDVVEVQPPTGTFTPGPGAGGHHVLVAAGSGITPVLSITATLLQSPDVRVSLLYGNRTTASVMFVEELSDLKDRYGPRLQLVHVLSREAREIELFSGRLDPERLRRIFDLLVPLDDVAGVWLCGPFAMVSAARDLLRELGVAPARIHVELFYVEDIAPPAQRHADEVYDGPTSAVSVTFDGRRSELVVPRDATLLSSAQRARPDLPFACKGGVCGTCRARVTHGQVHLRRNYALEDDELAAGFVLTCQSLPVSERVSLDYDA